MHASHAETESATAGSGLVQLSSFLTSSVDACPVVLGLQGFWDSSADSEGGGADFRHDLNTTATAETEIRCSCFVSGDPFDTSFSIRRTHRHTACFAAHVHRVHLTTVGYARTPTPCYMVVVDNNSYRQISGY